VLVLLLAPASALAHVTIMPDTSRPGETGEFGFRVQNERADAATDKLEVFIPDGVPVEAEPARGWTITRIPGGLQWSGSSIPPGRTEEFKVRLGPLPDRGQLVFKALQYYADGQVVRWIQDPSDEQRPAAVLDLGGKVSLAGDVVRPDEERHNTGLWIAIGIGFFGLLFLLLFLVWRWKA